MVDVVKGGGRAPPTLTSQANFTLITECMPESGRNHSVYSVVISMMLLSSRICSGSSCREGDEGEGEGEEGEVVEEREELEEVRSCSQERVGEVCAPVNCKFTAQKQECAAQNREHIKHVIKGKVL
jgi:hypothetical protein